MWGQVFLKQCRFWSWNHLHLRSGTTFSRRCFCLCDMVLDIPCLSKIVNCFQSCQKHRLLQVVCSELHSRSTSVTKVTTKHLMFEYRTVFWMLRFQILNHNSECTSHSQNLFFNVSHLDEKRLDLKSLDVLLYESVTQPVENEREEIQQTPVSLDCFMELFEPNLPFLVRIQREVKTFGKNDRSVIHC